MTKRKEKEMRRTFRNNPALIALAMAAGRTALRVVKYGQLMSRGYKKLRFESGMIMPINKKPIQIPQSRQAF